MGKDDKKPEGPAPFSRCRILTPEERAAWKKSVADLKSASDAPPIIPEIPVVKPAKTKEVAGV